MLDPAQYTKADTKMVWVTKLADTPDGMIAREDGKFLGRFRGSVITRYRWDGRPSIDVTLEHGVPRALHAWFEIDAVEGGTRIRHVEELDLGHGPLGRLHDLVAGTLVHPVGRRPRWPRSPGSSRPASAAVACPTTPTTAAEGQAPRRGRPTSICPRRRRVSGPTRSGWVAISLFIGIYMGNL